LIYLAFLPFFAILYTYADIIQLCNYQPTNINNMDEDKKDVMPEGEAMPEGTEEVTPEVAPEEEAPAA
jgi:hypothetical protein